VEVFDLVTHQVSDAAIMPDLRAEFGCVASGGKVYVIGGRRIGGMLYQYSSTTLAFDPEANVWSTAAPMPTARAADAVLVDGGFVVVPGGFNGRESRKEVEVFSPRENVWRSLPGLRSSVTGAAAFLGAKLYLFGRYDAPKEIHVYDFETRKSGVLKIKSQALRFPATAVLDSKIYVIGGRTTGGDARKAIDVYALR
jgi:N-acetylneuraminic acid mutarotase